LNLSVSHAPDKQNHRQTRWGAFFFPQSEYFPSNVEIAEFIGYNRVVGCEGDEGQ
jgi:hypothetical protein